MAAVALLAGGLIVLWATSGDRPQETPAALAGTEERAFAEPAASPAPSPAESRTAARQDESRSAPGGDDLPPITIAPAAPDVAFDGKLGSLRGHVVATSEEPFPTSWRLVARPSTTMPRREHAVNRTLAFEDGRQDFELLDLPLGGYDVLAEAEGYNGQVLPILIQPGSEHAFVNLVLIPTGFLEGNLVDAEHLPAEGIPVTLIGVADNLEREAVSGPDGVFRFDSVPDGAYELLVGRVTAPVVPERMPLRFQAPSLTYPEIELPPLATLDLRVVDGLERPLEGVTVRGSGTNGGVVERTTDYDGRVVQKHLPAGHYRIRLEHPGLGSAYSRRFAVDLVAGEVTKAPVRLGP